MVMAAMKTGRVENGRVPPSDRRITLAQSSSDGPDQLVWVALDKGMYEIRFERSPFNDSAAPETILPGEVKTVSNLVPKDTYKYSVYQGGKQTDDPDVVVV